MEEVGAIPFVIDGCRLEELRLRKLHLGLCSSIHGWKRVLGRDQFGVRHMEELREGGVKYLLFLSLFDLRASHHMPGELILSLIHI